MILRPFDRDARCEPAEAAISINDRPACPRKQPIEMGAAARKCCLLDRPWEFTSLSGAFDRSRVCTLAAARRAATSRSASFFGLHHFVNFYQHDPSTMATASPRLELSSTPDGDVELAKGIACS